MVGRTPNYPEHDGLPPRQSRYVDTDKLDWIDAWPGVRVKILYQDDEAKEATVLYDVAPGGSLPEHLHTGIENTFMIEGSLEDDVGACTAGNFVWRPVGSRHAPRCPNGGRWITTFKDPAKVLATGQLFPKYGDAPVAGEPQGSDPSQRQ